MPQRGPTDSSRSHDGGPGLITSREQEVAELIAHGLSNQQIAERLVLTPGTVANHVANILSKLGARSRVEVAVTIARDQGRSDAETILGLLEMLREVGSATAREAMEHATTVLATTFGADKVDAFFYDAATNLLIALGTSQTPRDSGSTSSASIDCRCPTVAALPGYSVQSAPSATDTSSGTRRNSWRCGAISGFARRWRSRSRSGRTSRGCCRPRPLGRSTSARTSCTCCSSWRTGSASWRGIGARPMQQARTATAKPSHGGRLEYGSAVRSGRCGVGQCLRTAPSAGCRTMPRTCCSGAVQSRACTATCRSGMAGRQPRSTRRTTWPTCVRCCSRSAATTPVSSSVLLSGEFSRCVVSRTAPRTHHKRHQGHFRRGGHWATCTGVPSVGPPGATSAGVGSRDADKARQLATDPRVQRGRVNSLELVGQCPDAAG
jgi:DNA-binding CsgD family transcriptional regulator